VHEADDFTAGSNVFPGYSWALGIIALLMYLGVSIGFFVTARNLSMAQDMASTNAAPLMQGAAYAPPQQAYVQMGNVPSA